MITVPASIEEKWQEIIDLMAKIIGVPSGLIMRINGSNIEVFIASQTQNNPYKPGDREYLPNSGLYCETVINTSDKLIVPNALNDPDWCSNPDVKLNMISYMGFPILLPDNTPFGTICVLDNKENKYSELFSDLVEKFRNIINRDIELLYLNQELGLKNKQLTDIISEIKTLKGLIPICSWCRKVRDDDGFWKSVETYLEEHSAAEFTHGICEECKKKLFDSPIKSNT